MNHKVLALFFILLFLAQLVLFTSSLNGSPDFSIIKYGFEGQSLKITYSMTSRLTSQDIGIFVMPLSSPLQDRDVYIYYDRRYPNSLVGRKEWLGIADHMFVQLKTRGYRGAVSTVDANRLQKLMSTKEKSVIIIPSGVFPDTVHNSSISLVHDWLEAGGILIWAGDLIGLYYGHLNEEWYDLGSHVDEIQNWQENVQRILSYNVISSMPSDTNIIVTEDSVFSNALDLRYEDASRGPVLDELLANNGVVLGKVGAGDSGRTSVAFLPVGSGGVVLFAGTILPGLHTQGVTYVARDMAQILTSGFIDSSKRITTSVHHADKGKTMTDEISVSFTQEEDFVFVAFSRLEFNPFYYRLVIQRP